MPRIGFSGLLRTGHSKSPRHFRFLRHSENLISKYPDTNVYDERTLIGRYLATIPSAETELANFSIQMADFNALTGGKGYNGAVMMHITETGHRFELVRGGIAFGTAAARAYKDEAFLDYASEAWN
ncbi:hypothetical protein VNI00_012181 [Paramarasmius palmivorus]|uniref:Uncharacterized protein n=1 Tax=Paramarasmius palmivorus TaxID=297713 RepID=A0AAW0C5Z8_9AGAR